MAAQLKFDDSAAYERFVGTWGRAAGAAFLDWLRPPPASVWLDVGCGTGLFTELILQTCRPACVLGIDPAQEQIDYANQKPIAKKATFQVGDAQSLPFESSTFDVVASALVLNFIRDRLRALDEMRRVVRPGGVVAGYVWDFVAERSPSGPFRLGMRDALGTVPALPGAAESGLESLRSLFERAGFRETSTCVIDVTVSFSDFEAFWLAQTPGYAPTTDIIANLPEKKRLGLIEAVKARLGAGPGPISYPARANAISARAS